MGFQAVIKSAASAASPAAEKYREKMKEKLPFGVLYIGIPIGGGAMAATLS